MQKLVDCGSIPSRRVNGELVFSRDEVHRWLESKIGGTEDDDELAHVETALDHSVPPGAIEETVSIVQLIPEGGIALPLSAKTRDSAIRSMVKLAGNTGLLWDPEKMTDAIKEREELHSTALDNGVALLHPRRPMPAILGETFIVLGIVGGGIPFGSSFGNLTDIFFLLASMDDRVHLRVLARLSRILTAPKFMSQLRDATNETEIRRLIATTEAAF